MNKSSLTQQQLWIVAKWEFLHFFKLKQEIISKLIMLAIAGVIYFFATANSQLEQGYHLASNLEFSVKTEPTSTQFKFTKHDDLTAIIAPNSVLTIVLSYLPITAFAVMPVRMSLVEIPIWQALLSLLLSIGCFYYLRIFAARIFKMGMNMYAKEPSLKAMWLSIFK
ncbi:hypothetical protein [Pseudoalteromonas rhizosphaerae]|uniref:ABC transporter permease n=1 Tax=Pseudoalteromonas rhizosphaerae TaxID=2518973 RepID=A0ABW8KVL5_9GAMM